MGSSHEQTTTRWLPGLLGIVLLLLSFWMVRTPAGLVSESVQAGEIPVEIIYPTGAGDGSRPLALIGHGFAGSGVMMRGFAHTLAKAGFVAAVWDFDGHGHNPNPLASGLGRDDLVQNAEAVRDEVARLGIADTGRVAILGHSMGSGVALTYGQRYPETMATIAISPVGVAVTPDLPRNLLLLAGSNEAAFLRNAEARLAEAGGAGGDPAAGTARQLIVIPGVEHVSIVFAPATHQAARAWLEAIFGAQAGAQDYTDLRILWYTLGLVGAILAAIFLAPPTLPRAAQVNLPLWRGLLSLAGGSLGATLLLALLTRLGLDLSSALGLQVGGYLLVWFGIAGLLGLLLLGKSAWRVWLNGKVLLSGLLVGAFLWLGIGLLGGQVWLPWLLIPERLVFYPIALILSLPWLLAVGIVSENSRPWGRFGWWLVNSLLIATSLLLALRLTPGIYFLVLILPVFPLVLGLHALAAGRQRHPWAFGLSGAILIGWMLLAVFPLS